MPSFQTPVLVRNEHFKAALHQIIPSTQRGSDILVDYKPVKWQEIGGLEDVKMKLKQVKICWQCSELWKYFVVHGMLLMLYITH